MVDTCRTLHQKEKNKQRANDMPMYFQIVSTVCAVIDSSSDGFTNYMRLYEVLNIWLIVYMQF